MKIVFAETRKFCFLHPHIIMKDEFIIEIDPNSKDFEKWIRNLQKICKNVKKERERGSIVGNAYS